MGFIEKRYTTELNAYLTPRGREMLLNGERENTLARYFSLGDSDRNYQLISDDRVREMLIPDVTGDKSDSLYSIAQNIDIKHRVGTFKPIENATSFQRSLVYVPTPTLRGAEVKMVLASRVEDIFDDNKTMFGNMFSSLNLPCTTEDINEFLYGMYSTNAFQYLNTDTALIIEIPKNTYGELIDGKTIRLRLELENSQMIDIYSTFFENSALDANGNLFYTDPNQFSSKFGNNYKSDEILPGQHGLATPLKGFNSNVAYLFTDYVKKPRNISTNTWASTGTYFKTQTNVPSGKVADKFYAKYTGAQMDTPVGIAYLDKGFLVITHPNIINNLKTAKIEVGVPGTEISGTNNYALKQFYYNSTVLDFSSFSSEFIQHAVCACLPNEFYETNNPTYDVGSDRAVAITEIGLYNSSFELIAYAKPGFPIAKDKYSILSFNINIRV